MIQIGMWMKQLICHMHVRIVLRNFLLLQKWKSTKWNVHPQISWNHQLRMKQFIWTSWLIKGWKTTLLISTSSSCSIRQGRPRIKFLDSKSQKAQRLFNHSIKGIRNLKIWMQLIEEHPCLKPMIRWEMIIKEGNQWLNRTRECKKLLKFTILTKRKQIKHSKRKTLWEILKRWPQALMQQN